ncbi:MAG: nucleotidyltransferase family protein [Fimbriimonadaceae bacterium]|nr:nucleotidyltransferase family protein [Fimbriimonadaceae bacterium]
MDVVILAGGALKGEWKQESGLEWRWQLPVHDHTIFDQVHQSVRHLGDVIAVGGPEEHRRAEPGNTFLDSLAQGMALVRSETMLLVTADIPDLSSDAVDRFLASTSPAAELNYPIVPIEVCERAYPGMRRTTLPLREGRFTGGNAAYVHTESFRQALPTLERAYALRKSPARLAGMVGYGTLGRVLLSQLLPMTLPIRELERRVGRFLGMDIRAVICHDASVGTDIDSQEQYNAWLANAKS